MTLVRYEIPWTVKNGKNYRYETIWASSELKALDVAKRLIRQQWGSQLKFTVWHSGMVCY